MRQLRAIKSSCKLHPLYPLSPLPHLFHLPSPRPIPRHLLNTLASRHAPVTHSSPVRAFMTSNKLGSDISDTKKRKVNMEEFPPERIRNLSIIAHIDHGKSTLADRLMEMTKTLPPASSPQFLDKLKVERERGITVKAQTVSLIHTHTDGKQYLINLIDTPGHVDFSYEVSRSLGACEGGLLLVDCTQGIQAQTLSVYHHAVEANLTLLPVINKVDLPHASPDATSEQIVTSLGLAKETHMPISAKSGLGVGDVLNQIVEGLPAPHWVGDDRLRALVFDTFYDRFRGVVSLVRIISGTLKKGDRVRFLQAGKKYEVLDVGIYNPEEVPVEILMEGQVGYLVCNMKNSDEAYIGDTVCWADKAVDALPGFKPMKAMVFAGVFPMDSSEFPQLEESIGRLTLNDRSVSVERESSAALGQGFRLGFLGTLHMDVFRQRLEDEYSSNVIVTAPTVPYKVVYHGEKQVYISNPAEFPDVTDPKSRVLRVEEPMVNATIFVPTEYIGEMMDLCARYRGVQQEYRFLEGTDRAILRYSLPLSEIVTDFFSELKSASSGFASFDYEEAGYLQSNLVKLNMMLNGKPVDALAMIVHRTVAAPVGRSWARKLKEVLPRQLFELAIQAAVGSKVVARETLSAMRKDVTAGLYGGHYERKMKHLNKQKEGKKRLKRLAGNIDIPQSAFFDVLSSRPRAYSTCTRSRYSLEFPQQQAINNSRRLSQSTHSMDPFSKLLPQLPLPPFSDASSSSPSPIPTPSLPPFSPPAIAPEQRSRILSDIHRQITPCANHNPDKSSEQLYADFTSLYLSSPTPMFTPPELSSIARAMHAMDRRARIGRQLANERLTTVVDALRDVLGSDTKATRGLELAILVSASRHHRRVRVSDVREAERQFHSLFPTPPNNEEVLRKKLYRACFNQIIYLSAMAGSEAGVEKWWKKMMAAGFEPDSWAFLAHMTLYERLKRHDDIMEVLDSACSSKPDTASNVILVNCAMWFAVRAGKWDVVAALYKALCRDPPEIFTDLTPITLSPAIHDALTTVTPSHATYAMLVPALAYAGDLVSSLTIMQHMLNDGHVPGLDEYAGLFRGFSKFGIVQQGPAGDASSAFPPWYYSMPRHGAPGFSGDLGGAFTSNFSPSGRAGDGPWTRDALEHIFTSFLALVPGRKEYGARSPRTVNPNATYFALVAFARVTNADAAVVRAALHDMDKKFGEGNTEGWIGWRESKRMRKIRDAVE